MTQDEKTLWDQKYREGSHRSLKPDPFLVSAYNEFLAQRDPGRALDVAGGVGRHALWLAQHGWQVKLVDISATAIALAEKHSKKLKPPLAPGILETQIGDLDSFPDLGQEEYDAILVFFYLQRQLFPALVSALKPEGVLICKTYTIEQRRFAGGPSHPLHLLRPNELLSAFPGLRVLRYQETIREKGLAELIAMKTSQVLLWE